MLYSFDNFLSPDALQSWFAAARDQATMQLIAVSTLQQGIEANLRKTVESSAILMEQELELPFVVGAATLASKENATKKRGGARLEPSGLKH